MKEQVIELAKQAGLWVEGFPTHHIERFATLVRNAAIEEAAQKLRQTAAELGIYNHHATKQFLAAIESLKEPTP